MTPVHEHAGCCIDAAVDALAGLVRASSDYKTENVTEATIEVRLDAARSSIEHDGHSLDAAAGARVIGLVKMQFTIRQDEASRLSGREGVHTPWLAAVKADIFVRHGFWDNYRRLLEQRLPDHPRNRLDEVTDQILDNLENPRRQGQWDRRGLVMGQVQSGKTNNYIGLICKAADAGYKLIIVLAGTHNNLRAQTQFRVDEGLTGRDTRLGANSAQKIGVGLEPGHHPVVSLTSATDTGDFRAQTANSVGFHFGAIKHPTVFVVKKNVTVLENLYDWIHINAEKPEGHERVAGIPLLVIDDEADNASINTAVDGDDPETDPTRTNSAIRRLLNSFDQSAYVGYTATPFANIFIDPHGEHAEVGEDLFPRDFLFSIPAPTNYVGPELVFGVAVDDDDDDDLHTAAIPFVSQVNDSDNWIPPRHKADLRPVADLFPATLERAMKSFILSCAASRARGLGDSHRSMLIHVTPYVSTQAKVREQVADRLHDLKNTLLYDNNDIGDLRRDLEAIWESDFVPVARAVRDMQLDEVPIHDYSDIEPHLAPVVAAITVRMINGSSADALDYYAHPDGLKTIVIGGAKLSRGLTLEGLVVSYYLRTTRMYDTLMQMGRWFGYRPGYLDLCRIYTTSEIARWYQYVTRATNELLADLSRMEEQNATPADFGLRVRQSPGLLVTAPSKMRFGVTRSVTFSNSRPETTTFDLRPEIRRSCIDAADAFLRDLGPADPEARDIRWTNVDPAPILRYLRDLATRDLYQHARSAVPRYLADYLDSANRTGGLVNWTVVLRSSQDVDASSDRVGGHEVGLARRSHSGSGDLATYSIKGLIGSQDEGLDLTSAQREKARAEAKARGTKPYGADFRRRRDPADGLMIIYPLDGTEIEGGQHIKPGPPFIGYCLSLPLDPTVKPIKYRLNRVF